jgi:hypothetical protein
VDQFKVGSTIIVGEEWGAATDEDRDDSDPVLIDQVQCCRFMRQRGASNCDDGPVRF